MRNLKDLDNIEWTGLNIEDFKMYADCFHESERIGEYDMYLYNGYVQKGTVFLYTTNGIFPIDEMSQRKEEACVLFHKDYDNVNNPNAKEQL